MIIICVSGTLGILTLIFNAECSHCNPVYILSTTSTHSTFALHTLSQTPQPRQVGIKLVMF